MVRKILKTKTPPRKKNKKVSTWNTAGLRLSKSTWIGACSGLEPIDEKKSVVSFFERDAYTVQSSQKYARRKRNCKPNDAMYKVPPARQGNLVSSLTPTMLRSSECKAFVDTVANFTILIILTTP
jgi:hypothetical protein